MNAAIDCYSNQFGMNRSQSERAEVHRPAIFNVIWKPNDRLREMQVGGSLIDAVKHILTDQRIARLL